MKRRLGFRAALALVLAGAGLASCEKPAAEQPAGAPALWEVSGPGERKAWLFGTIHALPSGAQWFTPRLDSAIERTGVLVVEIAELADSGTGARAFAAVARSSGLPPLLQRLPPPERPALADALARANLRETDFAVTETWAAALLIANATGANDSANGVDRVLLSHGLPVIGLEDFSRQFALFDRLAEADQATLLYEAASDTGPEDERALTEAWLRGDMERLEAEEREGLLADPELREALLTRRNRAWVAQIAALIERDRRPLVAVGAAHLVGPEGLPALLEARGYQVRRIQ